MTREPETAGVGPSSPASEPPAASAPHYDEPDEAAVRAEMDELERQLADAPAEDVVANHCYGLFQLAALHLGQSPPRLDDARLAIDAFAAVVESLGDRLGPATGTLRDGLAQIRLAFVQISAVQQTADASAAGVAVEREGPTEPSGTAGAAGNEAGPEADPGPATTS